eukprot:TRINITY_DN1330_c1_g5_i1.p1 TRINITY_DN1330_c1_g5~~TRINITY_DN1330_c1_g5_i1.p1  ORF type:complete len:244 (-),score=94.74 TRINITY_DN1330_c1_g5_i1:168-848(-)
MATNALIIKIFLENCCKSYIPHSLRRRIREHSTLESAKRFRCFYNHCLIELSILRIENNLQTNVHEYFDGILNLVDSSSMNEKYKTNVRAMIRAIKEDDQNLNANECYFEPLNFIVANFIYITDDTFLPTYSGQRLNKKLSDSNFGYGAQSYFSFYEYCLIRLLWINDDFIRKAICEKLIQLAQSSYLNTKQKQKVFFYFSLSNLSHLRQSIDNAKMQTIESEQND